MDRTNRDTSKYVWPVEYDSIFNLISLISCENLDGSRLSVRLESLIMFSSLSVRLKIL